MVSFSGETETSAQVHRNRPTMQNVMRRGGFRLALAIFLMGSLGGCCQLPKPRKPYPSDPMFESKQPLEKPTRDSTNPDSTPPSPIAAAFAAPVPPQFPQSFLVAPFLSSPPGREDHDRD